MRRYLIVDGNYFAQRVLGSTKFTLTSESEKHQFKVGMYLSLVNLWTVFRNRGLVDQLLFCADFNSWRKSIEPFKPYWLEDTKETPIGYKAQRKTKKDESPIDYDAFYSLYSEFTDSLKEHGVVVFKTNGLEGDDNISLLSNYIRQNDSMRGIIFATDGDLEQCVNNNVLYFKNVHSKDAPNGEVVMSYNNYINSFEQEDSIEKVLMGNQSELDWVRKVCNVVIGDLDGVVKVNRTLNQGIRISRPFKTLFTKSFAGDKKDNLFSPISWLSANGSVRYGITEKILSKVFDEIHENFTEQNCLDIMNTPSKFDNFVSYLISCSKDKQAPFETVKAHIMHNIRMNSLSPLVAATEIPRELKEQFAQQLIEQKDTMETDSFPTETILNVIQVLNEEVKRNIFEESIEII